MADSDPAARPPPPFLFFACSNRNINPTAEILRTTYSAVPDLGFILDVHSEGNSRYDPSEFAAKEHDATVQRAVISFPGAMNQAKFDAWFKTFLAENGDRVYRSKGVFAFNGQPNRVVLQGVHGTYSLVTTPRPWETEEEKSTLLVLIGKRLNQKRIAAELQEIEH